MFIFLVAKGFIAGVQAQGETKIRGIVFDENGNPIHGANITVFSIDHRIRFEKRVTTDAAGRFYVSVGGEGSYLVYVTYDDKKTRGVDYIPERWRVWLSSGSESSRKFILKKGASLYLDGEIRYIQTNRPAIKYRFIVLGLEEASKDEWTGPVRDYGSYSHLVRFFGFDERLIIVPAETEVKIHVTAIFPTGQTQSFILTRNVKIPQGGILHIDVREQNILSNVKYVKEMLDSSFSLLDNCLTAGFLVEAEKRDLLNAYSAIDESLSLLKKGLFDQSFAKLRTAYISITNAENALKGLMQTGSQSILPLLLLFLFIASASAHLISEGSSHLEITTSDRKFSVPINFLVEVALYVFLILFFFLVFPGCHLIPRSTYMLMAGLAFIAGEFLRLIFSIFSRSEESEERSIQLKSAIIAAFSMGCRNLRRRKMRTILNLLSIIILIFGFIVLTSISVSYGLSVRVYKPVLPVRALFIKDEPSGEPLGSFIALPESFIEWLESYPNVTLVSPKAENSMVSASNPLGRLYSESGKWINILGIIGIIPSNETNMTGLNRIVINGSYLRDDDVQGILLSSTVQKFLRVDVGDKVYGFGQAFVVKGFFDGDALSELLDVNGKPFMPYFIPPGMPGQPPTPCPSDNVIILTYKKALTLPKVSTSRVIVQLSNNEEYESLAKILALTYEYKVYVSNPEYLIKYSLEKYIEERGLEIVPFFILLVMLNIGTSIFASVHERKNEISTLSLVGLNPAHIAVLFVAEALIIGFIGGGLGYLSGISGYRLVAMIGGFQIREKASAEWGLISVFLSGAIAVAASLIPALRSSTLATPSLIRKWRIDSSAHSKLTNEPWILDLPIKLMSREIEQFTAFIVRRLREEESMRAVGEISFEEKPSDKGKVRKIRFNYYFPEKAWTENEIIVQPGENESYNLKLICNFHGISSKLENDIHEAATYVRKIILEYSAATCEVVTLFDPCLSQFYNLINTYNPTTLYVISPSTYSEDMVDEKIGKLREALISRGIRPPMFPVSRVNPLNLKEVLKAVRNVVSKADIVCISGENVMFCTALAIEAIRQKKIICYVVDDRLAEERMKNPFKELEVLSLF